MVHAAFATIGIPVTVDRIEVHTGTCCMGITTELSLWSAEIAAEIPIGSAKLQRSEGVIEFCRSTNFSVEQRDW